MKNRIAAVSFPIALIAVSGSGWFWWQNSKHIETTDNAYVQSDIVSVSPKISGYIQDILVRDNERVQSGQVLVVIDDREYVATVAKAAAAVRARQAAVATVDDEISLQKTLVKQARATVEGAQAAVLQAHKEFDRMSRLLKSAHISRQRFDLAEASSQEAEAQARIAAAALTAQKQQIDVLSGKRDELQARLDEAEAELALAEQSLDSSIIVAPIDGIVGNKGVQLGEYVVPGRQLMLLVPTDEIYVVANFKETQIGRMVVGQTVWLKFDILPGKEFEGRIESFAPASGVEFSLLPPENATGNFTKVVQRVPVKISLLDMDRHERLLRPGLSAEVRVDTRATTRSLDNQPRNGRSGDALAFFQSP